MYVMSNLGQLMNVQILQNIYHQKYTGITKLMFVLQNVVTHFSNLSHDSCSIIISSRLSRIYHEVLFSYHGN